jgi:hypothetical protein
MQFLQPRQDGQADGDGVGILLPTYKQVDVFASHLLNPMFFLGQTVTCLAHSPAKIGIAQQPLQRFTDTLAASHWYQNARLAIRNEFGYPAGVARNHG